MKKLKLRSDGFHAFAVIAVLLIIGVIGLVGLRVFNLQSGSKTEGQTLSGPSPQTEVQIAPPNWRVFTDKTIGIQFAYPQEFDPFEISAATRDSTTVQTSNRLSTSIMPGVTGAFSLKTYKKDATEIRTRRYGPLIKLEKGEWIVARPNELDAKKYKKGDVYAELTRTNLHGLEVYSAETGDEGMISYTLYFITGKRLHLLELPPFDSEQYTSTYNINDRGPYDTMYRQVLDSLRLY